MPGTARVRTIEGLPLAGVNSAVAFAEADETDSAASAENMGVTCVAVPVAVADPTVRSPAAE